MHSAILFVKLREETGSFLTGSFRRTWGSCKNPSRFTWGAARLKHWRGVSEALWRERPTLARYSSAEDEQCLPPGTSTSYLFHPLYCTFAAHEASPVTPDTFMIHAGPRNGIGVPRSASRMPTNGRGRNRLVSVVFHDPGCLSW